MTGAWRKQTTLFSLQLIPLRSSYLGFWLEEEVHSFSYHISVHPITQPASPTECHLESSLAQDFCSLPHVRWSWMGWVHPGHPADCLTGSTTNNKPWQSPVSQAGCWGWNGNACSVLAVPLSVHAVDLPEDHVTPAVRRASDLLWVITKTKSVELLFSSSLSLIYPTMFCWLLCQRMFCIHTCLLSELTIYNSIPSFPTSNFLSFYDVSNSECFFNDHVGENTDPGMRILRI